MLRKVQVRKSVSSVAVVNALNSIASALTVLCDVDNADLRTIAAKMTSLHAACIGLPCVQSMSEDANRTQTARKDFERLKQSLSASLRAFRDIRPDATEADALAYAKQVIERYPDGSDYQIDREELASCAIMLAVSLYSN